MSARAAQFERDEQAALDSLQLEFEIKDAGSWHAARCTGPGARVCGACADDPTDNEEN